MNEMYKYLMGFTDPPGVIGDIHDRTINQRLLPPPKKALHGEEESRPVAQFLRDAKPGRV